MKLISLLSFGLVLVIISFTRKIGAKGFEVVKYEAQPVEASRIHQIQAITTGSLLGCIQECKSLSVVNYPTCNAVHFDDATKICSLSYVHKSSKSIDWDPSSIVPSVDTKNIFVMPGAELSAHNCGVQEKGWSLVRHVTDDSPTWHRSVDYLTGTSKYGDQITCDANVNCDWSLKFEEAVPGFDNFLLATGDCSNWMVITKQELIGSYYDNSGRMIQRSSSNPNPYSAIMYRRTPYVVYDPLVCIDGWANKCIYVEASWTGALDQLAKGGANVYVRNSITEDCFEVDINYPRNDIHGKSGIRDTVTQCLDWCRQTPGCRIMSWRKSDKYCWLKTKRGKVVRDSNILSGPSCGMDTILFNNSPLQLRQQDDPNDKHTKNGVETNKYYINLPTFLSEKFPMLGTVESAGNEGNSLYLPEKTLIYLLRKDIWDTIKDIGQWTFTGYEGNYWGPLNDAKIYKRMFEPGHYTVDNNRALHLFADPMDDVLTN